VLLVVVVEPMAVAVVVEAARTQPLPFLQRTTRLLLAGVVLGVLVLVGHLIKPTVRQKVLAHSLQQVVEDVAVHWVLGWPKRAVLVVEETGEQVRFPPKTVLLVPPMKARLVETVARMPLALRGLALFGAMAVAVGEAARLRLVLTAAVVIVLTVLAESAVLAALE